MPSTICGACGIVFQEGKKYCRACGAPLRLKYALLPYVVSSCGACTVEYVVDRRECVLCGQLLAPRVEQVVGAGTGAVAAGEASVSPTLLPQETFQAHAPPPDAALGSSPPLPGSLRPTRFTVPQRARMHPDARELPRDGSSSRVARIPALLVLGGLGIAGVVAALLLVTQFSLQPEPPQLPPQLTLVGSNQIEEGRQTSALSRSTRAKKAETYNERGSKLAGTGNIEGAIAEFRRAVAVDPTNFKAHNNLGVLYQQKGWVPQAITAYRTASKAAPGHPIPYKNMAILNEERSEITEALQNYARYLDLAPNAPDRETIRLKIRELRGRLDTKPTG